MCSGVDLAAWQARTIRALVDSGHAEPALLILNETPEPVLTRWQKFQRRLERRDLTWTLFQRLFVVRRARASRKEGLADVLWDVPQIGCVVERHGKWSEFFSAKDVAEIRRAKLDFILRFEFGIIRGEILRAARYGVWSFHHDDEQRYRGGPPSFWEIYDSQPVTGSVLQRLTERLDGGIVLHKGWFRTIDHSYARNRDQSYFGGSEWPARVAADIRNGVADYVDAPPTSSQAQIYRNPRMMQTILFALHVCVNFIANQLTGLFRADVWTVGLVHAPIETFLEPESRPEVHWLPEVRGPRYLADPFGAQVGGRLHLLVEDFDYRTRRGRIHALPDVGRYGGSTGPREAVDTAVHASYPFLFEHQGDWFCVPETFEAKQVVLYRAVDFPGTWTGVGALVQDVAALDPTVVFHDGRWWLFATDKDRGSNSHLYAWHATRLAGRWTPHAQNPIKTDVRSARPGGTPFVHQGSLYRPAQDNAGTYGGAVVLNRVDVLTPTEFREQIVGVIPPYAKPYDAGMHTLSSAGDVTLIDGKRRKFIWSAFKTELGARLHRRR